MKKRIHPRPRMSVKESQDKEEISWSISATMFLKEVEAIVGERPGPCEAPEPRIGIGRCGFTRRRCDACLTMEAWEQKVLDIVAEATDRGFYPYSSGPGRRFASEPSVYVHIRHPNILKVYWHGGLDI